MQFKRKNKQNLYMYLVLFQNTFAWKQFDLITEIVLKIEKLTKEVK